MKKFLGKWWGSSDIDIYEIEGKRLALYGWNGEKYEECFEVTEDLLNIINKDKKYEVKPIYQEMGTDDFEIIDYEII